MDREKNMVESKLCEMEEKFINLLSSEICEGNEYIAKNMEAIGEMTDWIKDIAEAKEKCKKAEYYSLLINEENNMMGYDNWRYPSSGRFASSGHGSYYGYRPMDVRDEENMYKTSEPWGRRFGYPTPDKRMPYSGRGDAYDNYLFAKRHYHETNSPEDEKKMNERLHQAIEGSIENIREVVKDANPELVKQAKISISKLFDEM